VPVEVELPEIGHGDVHGLAQRCDPILGGIQIGP
jgi:hypothetical protein